MSADAPTPNKSRRITRRRRVGVVQRRRRISPVAAPSFFTLMNLFSGFMALTQIHEGNYEYACWLIVVAGFFDVLDGMIARLTNGDSPFGVQLDSLSDIVSFGVAPAYLVWAFGLKEFRILGLIVASLPAICGAVRLARYNVEFSGEKKDYFSGLPIPGAAIAIVTLILNIEDAAWFNEYSLNNLSMLIPIVVVLSGLMVTNIKFEAMPKPTPGYIRNHAYKTAAYVLGLLLVIFLQQIGLLIVFTAYLLHGIGRAAYGLLQAILNAPKETDKSASE